jgi:hypothetical protein
MAEHAEHRPITMEHQAVNALAPQPIDNPACRATRISAGTAMASTIRPWEYVLYPELRQFAPTDQVGALRTAADMRFDAIELVGLVVALVVTVVATRYSTVDMGLAARFGAAIANFVVAIPLLLILAGPFYVRRTRRGLRAQLAERARSVAKAE